MKKAFIHDDKSLQSPEYIFLKSSFFSRFVWQTVAGTICPKHYFGCSPIFGKSKGSIKIFRILIQTQLVLQQTLKPGLTGLIWTSITTILIQILQIAS